MLVKNDWEKVKKGIEEDKERLIKTYELSIPQFDNLIKFCNSQITLFPVEEVKEDPMPEGVKEIIEGVK
jgi:hypothetical protein